MPEDEKNNTVIIEKRNKIDLHERTWHTMYSLKTKKNTFLIHYFVCPSITLLMYKNLFPDPVCHVWTFCVLNPHKKSAPVELPFIAVIFTSSC